MPRQELVLSTLTAPCHLQAEPYIEFLKKVALGVLNLMQPPHSHMMTA